MTNLIGTARALDDQAFLWRVKSACLTHAAALVSDPATPEGNGKNMALAVLSRPHDVEPAMLGYVAVDQVVAAAVKVTGGSEVDTTAVSDDDILRVVADKWSIVAGKYQNTPLA